MGQPVPYNRVASFTTIQQGAPTDPLPGDILDAELSAIKTTLDQLLANLALIQRDDGQVSNQSIGRDQLSPNLSLGFNAPKAWATNTNYTTLDAVFETGKFYRCEISHLSGVFADDLAAGRWSLIADFSGALGSATDVSVTPTGNISSTNAQDALVELQGDIDTINAAPILANPAVAPSTPANSDNSTTVATTAFVQSVLAASLALAMPVGAMIPWFGLTEPTNWVFANQQTLLRATFPALWAYASAEIAAGNTAWGAGDGLTTFTVPDMKGVVPVGRDNMGGVAAAGKITSAGCGLDGTSFGATGGAQNIALTAAQNGLHNHGGTTGTDSPDHAHTTTVPVTSAASEAPISGGPTFAESGNTNYVSGGANQRHAHSIPADGAGSPHSNVQPSVIVNYIIWTGKTS